MIHRRGGPLASTNSHVPGSKSRAHRPGQEDILHLRLPIWCSSPWLGLQPGIQVLQPGILKKFFDARNNVNNFKDAHVHSDSLRAAVT